MNSRVNVMIMVAMVLVILALSALFLNSRPETTVRNFLDAEIRGQDVTQYGDLLVVNKISNYKLKAYEIKNTAGSQVSVELTFESEAGTDLKETKIITVYNQRIAEVR